MIYAYIFDFDGVLANTMETHFACYRRALAEVNVPVDKAQFYRQAGMTGIEQITYFAQKAGVIVDPSLIYARTRELRKEEKQIPSPIECNIQLFKLLHSAGNPIAVASGSSRQSVLPTMKALGIAPDALVAAEDITRGKPHPELFLKAAEALGVAPEMCVVVEDSDVGIEAARAAGMKAMRFYL